MLCVGDLVRECRHEAQLTQQQLAQRAGTTQPMLVRYEKGQASPTMETLDRLVRACGQTLTIGHQAQPAGQPVPMSGPIGQAALAHRTAIRRLVHGAGASKPRVFGSVARGTETAESDLDLLVTFPVHKRGLLPLADLSDQISDLIGYPVDVAADQILADKVAATALPEAITL